MTELQQRVQRVISNIMGVPFESVTLESTPHTIDTWDSLQHMKLILALEQEFGVSFSDEQIVIMSSIGQIVSELENITKPV